MWNKCNEKAKMVVENECPHCHKKLLMNKRVFANHVRWCPMNPKMEEIKYRTISKIKEQRELKNVEEFGEIKEFKIKCSNQKCSKEFIVYEREKLFPVKTKYFCSKSCANSHNRSEESRRKTSESLNKYYEKNGKNTLTLLKKEGKTCVNCGDIFYPRKISQKCCSNKCSAELRSINHYKKLFDTSESEISVNKVLLNIYKKQCVFKFSLNEYKDEFDFNIIQENGWYSAKNHGDNLNGVSRDHMFSVLEGFRNKIDPYYISHPANCELLEHNKNASKSDKCSITKEELFDRVKKWNEKYGVYENKINYIFIKEYIGKQ